MIGDCPFKVGDTVYYRPSPRGQGLAANDSPSETPQIGQAVKISRIADGKYIEVEGFKHPGGGAYWTEFSAERLSGAVPRASGVANDMDAPVACSP